MTHARPLRLAAGDWALTTAEGLRVYATSQPGSEVFAEFYAGYDRAFVLPDEKEDVSGFERCLALNDSPAYEELAAKYGAFSEICLVADDIAAGLRVGGANVITIAYQHAITANLNYIYIDEAARGSGRFTPMLAAVRQTISARFETRPLMFIEQNDPFAMSAEAYERDTRYTGLDQFDRLRVWARRGARVVDFPYIQPPLSPGQVAESHLVYSVVGAPATTVPACILEHHLRGFFGISVLKGAAIENSDVARRQVELLSDMCVAGTEIPLLDPTMLLARVATADGIGRIAPRRPVNLRDAIHALG